MVKYMPKSDKCGNNIGSKNKKKESNADILGPSCKLGFHSSCLILRKEGVGGTRDGSRDSGAATLLKKNYGNNNE